MGKTAFARKRRTVYTAAHVIHLCTGTAWAFLCPDGVKFEDEELKPAWDELRGPIMRFWLKTFPRSRPWGWWRWEAGEYRLCTNGDHPFEDIRRIKIAGPKDGRNYELAFGKPTMWVLHPDDGEREYESESNYLRRLNLLEPGELLASRVADDKRFDTIQAFAESWLGY